VRNALLVACILAVAAQSPAADPAAQAQAAATREAAGPPSGRMAALLDDALSAMVMTRDDLTFRTDYADSPDSFRTSVVDSLLVRPLDTEPYVLSLADELAASMSAREIISICAHELRRAGHNETGSPAAGGAGRPATAESEGLDPVDILISGVRACALEMESAFAGLSAEERAFVAEHAAVLLAEEEFDPDKPIDVRDRESERDEELGNELLRVAALIDYDGIYRAASILAGATDAAVARLRAGSAPGAALGGTPRVGGAWSGDVVLAFETELGAVVVGGPGPTEYREPCAVIIDLGGDDSYLGAAAGAGPGTPAAVVIDVSGDDTYAAGDNSAGAGLMGVGILVDMGGDDSYSSGSFSQGSGLFGAGLLIDEGGDDRYAGDTCTQGSGAFGIGVLVDRGGNDSYEAALFSQAFGFVGGVGALLEHDGNDVYRAGGKYTDEIRYFDHYISLSQGFGFGWRPDASGGVGLLCDLAGNDVYVSDIFGQGASYWFAVGGLVDRSGNDQYVSYQYAQGAGTHITVAALVDLEGDDNYVSKGVSQGCGHDLAIGILHDAAGDDSYTCHDLSQGAGNANGIGVIIDDEGDDSYSVRNPDNTHGYGNLRRDYGSVGILIDGAGRDWYAGRGADGTWWMGSTYGIGIDASEEEGGAEE